MDVNAPLTPNTTAFLSYLSSAFPTPKVDAPAGSQPNGSLNPSAFFPAPAPIRDTPLTTPSSKDPSESPKDAQANLSEDSEYEEYDGKRRSRGGAPKRKAGQGHTANVDDDDDDTASDYASGHHDKRAHGADHGAEPASGSGRKGRKSEEGHGKKEMSKAARRKEQNRAAQKAFRERREAKVKDLEIKVAELENKAYGTNVENENLRGILKRLQEENVALKQAAFTFSMPMSKAAPGKGQDSPARLPTPPQSGSDDALRSINDVRQGSIGTPESLKSVQDASRAGSASGSSQPNPSPIYSKVPDSFNIGALGGGFVGPKLNPEPTYVQLPSVSPPSNSSAAPSATNPSTSPTSSDSNNRTEIDALWASFLDQQAQQRQQATQRPEGGPQPLNSQAYSFNYDTKDISKCPTVGSKPTETQPGAKFDKMAFRDTASNSLDVPAKMAVDPVPAPQANTVASPKDPWAGVTENSMSDFLASLTGSGDNTLDNGLVNPVDEEDFNQQLRQLLGESATTPSAMFTLPKENPFSPTNYLNMSPSPLVSVSNAVSPQSNYISSSASPDSSSGVGTGTSITSASHDDSCGSGNKDPDMIYVTDDQGNVMHAKDIWAKMGLKKKGATEDLLIDDLCDIMRAKATTKDGVRYLTKDEAVAFPHLRSELFVPANSPQSKA